MRTLLGDRAQPQEGTELATCIDRSFGLGSVAALILCWALLTGIAVGALHAQEIAPGLLVHQLTSDGKSYTERGAGFAPRGNQVVFYKEITTSDRQLWLMRDDGAEAHAISPVGWPMISGWSPDGTRIAYVLANKDEENSDACVCVYHVASGETKRITGGYKRGDFWAGDNAPPIWAPDGKHFAYQIYDGSRDASFLWVFPADGTPPTRIAGNLGGTRSFDTQGSWSPDGKRIVFTAYPSQGAESEVWVSNTDGTGLTQITNDRRDCGEPKWSPDGEWIVFFSAKDRYPDEERMGWKWDILLVRSDGSDEHTILSGRSQSTEGRGTFVHPEWFPDQSNVICHGSVQDATGRGYKGTFLIDWRTGDWWRILGTPVGVRDLDEDHDWAVSPDSKKVFRHGLTSILRGAGSDAQKTDPGDILVVYDVRTDSTARLLSFRRDDDPYHLYYDAESWAPDSRRILFCQAKVISWQQEQYEPDLYVLELPGEEPPEPEPQPTEATPGPEPAPTPPVEEVFAGHLIRPKHLTVQQALDSMPDSRKAYLETNRERNLLIVNGPAEVVDQIREYLANIDTPAPQVTLDVLVMEMSKTASRGLGLDWTHAEGHLGAQLPVGDFGRGRVFYQGVDTLDEKFFLSLSALEEKGQVSIRANPRLVALSGSTATMNIRRTKYYFYTQGYDQFGRPIIQQSDISADITGKITPQVLADGHILVQVEIGVGNFTFTSTSSLPDVTTRQATASVMVNEGETLMIGGLVLTQETKSVSKTPLLGDLPLLGQLFRASHRKIEENVLTILITPRLTPERGETGRPEP